MEFPCFIITFFVGNIINAIVEKILLEYSLLFLIMSDCLNFCKYEANLISLFLI